MGNQDTKVHENRLRRMAERQGLSLRKSKRRDPLALDYGGYWLIEASVNAIVAGESGVGLTLDEVENALTEPATRARGLPRKE